MDKLISEKAVLDVLRDYYRAWFLNDERFMDAVNAIKAIPSADKWIPVSERLPEDEEDVLFCAFGHIMLGYHPSDWKSTHFAERGSWELQKNVEAWMPLPKPYEPQERSE